MLLKKQCQYKVFFWVYTLHKNTTAENAAGLLPPWMWERSHKQSWTSGTQSFLIFWSNQYLKRKKRKSGGSQIVFVGLIAHCRQLSWVPSVHVNDCLLLVVVEAEDETSRRSFSRGRNTNPLSDVAVVVVMSSRPRFTAGSGCKAWAGLWHHRFQKSFKCDGQRCERAGSRNSRELTQPFNPDVLVSDLSGENETMRSEAVSSRCVPDGSRGDCDDWALGGEFEHQLQDTSTL